MSGAELEQRIAANLTRLHEKIAQAAIRAGRRPADVKLVAVSKTQPLAAVSAALAAGQTAFGESTVQDALTKIAPLAESGAEWHFIGHVQSNKARFIPGNFSWLHTLDSTRLAERLARQCAAHATALNVLIEVNIGRDPAKHGVSPEALLPLLDQLLQAQHAPLHWRGLMAIGPHPASEKEIHGSFAALRELRDICRHRFDLPAFSELSMGMSGDFTAAIEEGATLIRVGTAVFGERDYAGR